VQTALLCDVLIVADASDAHAAAIATHLRGAGATVAILNLSSLLASPLSARAGRVELEVNDSHLVVDERTTVWWHRAGTPLVDGLDPANARLAADEATHVLPGSLAGAGVRWVDHPATIAFAELKQYQLVVAQRLGVQTPDWIVTSDPCAARAFAADRPTVAKALSPGVGIAPYVDIVTHDELDLVANAPTLLQELVPAAADLRVVDVGDRGTWIWRRERTGCVDWRREDPSGDGFRLHGDERVRAAAPMLTRSLGLMSVQDWLVADDERVFLEANPQGAFLFLGDADNIVVPALSEHLR